MLIEGRWVDETERFINDGAFVRETSTFDVDLAVESMRALDAEPGRFRLIVSLSCPWSHQTLLVRAAKGLDRSLPVAFAGGPRIQGDAPAGAWSTIRTCGPTPATCGAGRESLRRSTSRRFSRGTTSTTATGIPSGPLRKRPRSTGRPGTIVIASVRPRSGSRRPAPRPSRSVISSRCNERVPDLVGARRDGRASNADRSES